MFLVKSSDGEYEHYCCSMDDFFDILPEKYCIDRGYFINQIRDILEHYGLGSRMASYPLQYGSVIVFEPCTYFIVIGRDGIRYEYSLGYKVKQIQEWIDEIG